MEIISLETVELNCSGKCEVRKERRAQDYDLELVEEKESVGRSEKSAEETEEQGSRGSRQGGGGRVVHHADCYGERTAQGMAHWHGKKVSVIMGYRSDCTGK